MKISFYIWDVFEPQIYPIEDVKSIEPSAFNEVWVILKDGTEIKTAGTVEFIE